MLWQFRRENSSNRVLFREVALEMSLEGSLGLREKAEGRMALPSERIMQEARRKPQGVFVALPYVRGAWWLVKVER